MDRDDILLVVLVIVNIPFYLLLGRLFFYDLTGFLDDFKDMLRLGALGDALRFQGGFADGLWAKFKILVFLTLCGLLVAGEYILIHRWFMDG